MDENVRLGIIGDYDENLISHPGTNTAIKHAADYLAVNADFEWIPTPALMTTTGLKKLDQFSGIWVSSGSPYRSLDGALRGIQYARERNRPLFGT